MTRSQAFNEQKDGEHKEDMVMDEDQGRVLGVQREHCSLNNDEESGVQ